MAMTDSLDGYGALVIGGGGGFGSAFAERLTRDGAAVTLMGRTADTLDAAAKRISALHPDAPDVRWVTGDGCNPLDVDAAAHSVDAAPLRICITTVGGGTIRPLLALRTDTLRADFDRNVVSAFLAIRHAAPVIASAGGGSIVCTSTSAGGFSFPHMPSYAVTKAALEALVRVAADELGHLGVRVNTVRPGLVDTGGAAPTQVIADPEQLATVRREKPLARLGTLDDISEGVRYLAGPESSWVTGIALPIEGGNHLRRAPDLEPVARRICGDEDIDDAHGGVIARSVREAELDGRQSARKR
jgi:NAD(P)-dependent dehydrogenase (short-subunit alcohol dehydrogenase family)